jgi:hypothetical protein
MTEGSGSVLGANTIRGHDVYFDITERSRIGFAPSECDYIKLTTSQSDDDMDEVETNKMEITEGGDGDDNDYEEDMDDEFTYEANDDEGLNTKQDKNDGGVDYYEDDELPVGTSTSPDDVTSFSFVFDTTRKSVTFVIVASMIVVALAVVIYKRMKGGPRYITTELESDHLNDLHLDTEIERLPAIA